MRAYRAKEIDHNVMQMIAGRLADDEIASLAVYFETLKEEL
jgi:cytochrome c553